MNTTTIFNRFELGWTPIFMLNILFQFSGQNLPTKDDIVVP